MHEVGSSEFEEQLEVVEELQEKEIVFLQNLALNNIPSTQMFSVQK